MNKKTLDEQFWSKVIKGNFDECWLWNGARNKAGYGNINVNGEYTNAHRVSYLLHYGEITPKLYVCHTCDIPSCVNPKHLFLGTPRDNDRDKVGKKRHIFGVKHPLAKLTENEVFKIRLESGTHAEIAEKYNVSRRLVGMIKNKKIWKHI